MNIAAIKKFDVSNGEGVRVSVFVSGCSLHCKGCHNVEAWDFDFGFQYTDEIENSILECCEHPQIKGLSILGGEPFDPKNRECVLNLIKAFRNKFSSSKNIWVWTGYTISQLKNEKSPIISEILKNVDVIVDGPFKEELRDVTLKFRGSSNQRILEKMKS